MTEQIVLLLCYKCMQVIDHTMDKDRTSKCTKCGTIRKESER